MLKPSYLSLSSDIFMTVYDFEERGDILDIHEHTNNDSHYSIVTNGMLQMFDENGIVKNLSPGVIEKIPLNYKHGFCSLVNDTRLINIPYKD